MDTVNLTIDGKQVRVPAGATILEAARSVDIYIPTLCHHPDLPPAKNSASVAAVFQGGRKIENKLPEEPGKGCGICVVEAEGRQDLVGSCATPVEEGMVITSRNGRIDAKRRESFVPFMTRHRHACLACTQQEGCSLAQCSANVPEIERCCVKFGHCELQRIANYVGIQDATPKWVPTDLPLYKEHALFERDYNLCIGCTRCVRACRDLRGIGAIGFVYNADRQVQVGSMAESLEDSGCKFCTACVEVCPTGALTDKKVGVATRKDDLVPCTAACPVRNDVPSYLRMVARGKRGAANAIIREKVPFPGILGRVCTHPCETVCRRGEVNEAISICALKRYAADGDDGLWKKGSRAEAATGKKVAVVGAGPAGLTAAFYLRKRGHAVTIFESNEKAGGMMRYGIPAYRLPRKVLDSEIDEILRLGIDFQPNQTLGRDFSLEDLTSERFDAVFLAVGAQKSKRLPLDGCGIPDVLWGVDFLRRLTSGEDLSLQGSVVVIGGGSVAVDAAMTALRCGASDVTLACLESAEEMPAGLREIEAAKAEGVKIMPSWGPGGIVAERGRVTGMELKECTWVFDENGRFCPEFSDRRECVLVDQVIIAVGQASDLSFLDPQSEVKIGQGLIEVDEKTMATAKVGVYAGGDAASAAGTIIQAIAAGRKAAAAIDRALGGSGDIDEVLLERRSPDPNIGRAEGFANRRRVALPEVDPLERIKGFGEISLGYSDEQALEEASRCLQCDLRLQLGSNPEPPAYRQAFDQAHIKLVPATEGVFQLLDDKFRVLTITGTADLRRDLQQALETNSRAVWFAFEADKMYSKRESELIQRHVQRHGEMPGGWDDELDDLY